jgi:hypothetical protein
MNSSLRPIAWIVGALTLLSPGCALIRALDPGEENWERAENGWGLGGHDSEDGDDSRAARELSGQPDPEEWALAQNRIRSTARTADVTYGMSPMDVRTAWGEPREVQHAGVTHSGNMRWVYNHGLNADTSGARVVYFENGRVAGWESF